MFSFQKIVAFSFTLLLLAACSGDEEIVRRFDENGHAYSPAVLKGSIEYLPSMEPEKVRIVRLKHDLSPIDSFEVSVKSSWNDYNFETDSRDFETPYVKIVTVFPAQGDKKMEFGQYIRLSDSKNDFKQSLYLALAADRIKKLMDKEGYSFEEAQQVALEELGQIFDSDLSDADRHEFSSSTSSHYRLGDIVPYIYCRHEISDSVFYSDFENFRKSFAKNGRIDSSWVVTAVDAWLSTFDVFADSMYYLSKSVSRDSVNASMYLDSALIGQAYDLLVSDSIVTIKTKSSDFYGRSLYKEWIGNGRSSTLLWRLVSSLEDSLGLCRHSEKQSKQRNGILYVCREYSHVWEIVTERDSLLNRQHGECTWYKNQGRLLYINDSLIVCECENSKCAWSDKYVNKVFQKSDSMYAKVLDVKAASKFGECNQLAIEGGERKQLDDVFVQCSNHAWKEIDSLNYYLGDCIFNEYDRGEHLGVYYGCNDEDASWGHDWKEIIPPVYYDSLCTTLNENEVLKFGDDYFICETNECKDAEGFLNVAQVYCYGVGSWRKLDSVEQIPPVINMDLCERPQKNLKVVYDDVFYECKNGTWQKVSEDSLVAPEKDGLICRDSLYGAVEKYDGVYYKCDTSRVWKVMKPLEALPYEYRDSLGLCDTISNKVLHWDDGVFVGCVVRNGADQWDVISVGTAPYTLPSSLNKKKLAGGTLADSVYTVTADGVEYRFNVVKETYTMNFYNLILEHMTFDGKGYDAYSYNGNLFLHAERGKDSVLLNSIENKSASFDDSYAFWKKRIGALWACPSTAEVKDEDVSVIMYNENTYMNYEKAKAFCPEGFHIPSDTEIERKLSYGTGNLYLRNDSPISWSFKGSGSSCSSDYLIYADVFWTSTEKDSDTQYCYETTLKMPTLNIKGNGFVECPKDLYPMVQVICVMDE